MISIIIPIYKMEHFLEKCLENIKSQSYKHWNIIIVNDGSDSPEKINHIAQEIIGEKCTVIHQENKGLSSARNTGIQAAKTDYVMSLDPDDYLHKDYLLEVMHEFQETNSDIVFCWTQVQGAINYVLDTKEVSLFNLLRGNLITSASPFRKDIWTKTGGFDQLMRSGHEDWEFWIRAYLNNATFSGIHKILFYYNVSESGMNTGATANRVNNIHYIRKKHSTTYSTSLYKLIKNPLFKKIPLISLIWFWLTNLFFLGLPNKIQKRIFEIYRKGPRAYLTPLLRH